LVSDKLCLKIVLKRVQWYSKTVKSMENHQLPIALKTVKEDIVTKVKDVD
tara:strand:- start:1838 stop:1987 length:150 start_codon:yes stop_codon:yes gene_type:complete